MTINTTLAGLSQTASLNGPDGAADLPSQYDDAIRYHGSFIAMLRDGVGFTAGAVVAGLTYTPVQQGTGTGQTTDAVKIGYSVGGTLRLQINATDFASTWPIGISGNAATATSATSATTAAQLTGGYVPTSFMIRGSVNNFTCAWTGSRIVFGVDGNTFSNIMPIDISGSAASAAFATSSGSSGSCSGNAATCTTATNANALGGIGASGWVQNIGSVTSLNNSGFTQIVANIGGTSCFWGMSVSDGRLKEDIAPTAEDSLAKIDRIEFVQYRFKQQPGLIQIDDGHLHKVGLIAQQAETIDPEWIVEPEGGHKQPDTYALLMDAMHAIKQLNAKVSALEARLAA